MELINGKYGGKTALFPRMAPPIESIDGKPFSPHHPKATQGERLRYWTSVMLHLKQHQPTNTQMIRKANKMVRRNYSF